MLISISLTKQICIAVKLNQGKEKVTSVHSYLQVYTLLCFGERHTTPREVNLF